MSRANGELSAEQVAALDRIVAGWDVVEDGPAPSLRDLRRHATNGNGTGRQMVPNVLSTVEPERVTWAWEQRIPVGAVTLLAGRQGLGKSTLLADLTAALTRGELPGDLKGQPTTVLMASYEDTYAATIVPRLLAARADLNYVVGLDLMEDGKPDLLSLPDDLELIAATAAEYKAKALLVDPLLAALSGGMDSHRDHDVRHRLAPIAQLAEDAGVAVLAVMHLRKGAANEALDRVSGSVAFTAAARSVLAFGQAEDDGEEDGDGDGRVLAHAKSNLGRLAPSLAYRVEGVSVEHGDVTIPTSRLVCTGEVDVHATELLSPPPTEDRTEVEIAAEWLADELGDGEWRASRDLKAAAKMADIRERTLKRAKQRLGIEDRREGFPAISEWRLPVGPGGLARQSGQEVRPDCENGSGKPNAAGSGTQLGQDALSGPTGPPCRYPDHRATDYSAEGGRTVCGTCHPRSAA